MALMFRAVMPVAAQGPPVLQPIQQAHDYVVGPQDVLVMTSYDQPELTSTFTIETDGTFTYPHIGRVRVGGLTLRGVETALKTELVDRGLFGDPQIAVAVEHYRSQKVHIVGEVRRPGTYPMMPGGMRLMEALAYAGSMLPGASGEMVIVPGSNTGLVLEAAITPIAAAVPSTDDPEGVIRVNVRDLEIGDPSQNVPLRRGDTIFVLRAESVYVFGQARNPGAYQLQHADTTVLQALCLAGGVTDRASTTKIKILRDVHGKMEEIRVALTDFVQPRDTIVVPERFF